jgi:hypothetical protein
MYVCMHIYAYKESFGEVVTVQPTERHTATVIWLHGLRDTGVS